MANEALAGYATDDDFVTGQIVRVDLASGIARVVNAGHPLPVRVRAGSAERIALDADLPFAARAAGGYRVQEVALEPGDRVVFLTDGMLERNAATVDVASVITESRHLHPRQAVQTLTRTVSQACGGQLRDDATVLCLDWHGGPPRDRDTTAGANR